MLYTTYSDNVDSEDRPSVAVYSNGNEVGQGEPESPEVKTQLKVLKVPVPRVPGLLLGTLLLSIRDIWTPQLLLWTRYYRVVSGRQNMRPT